MYESTKNMRIVFFGTSAFAVPILEKLVGNKATFRPVLIVTAPDAPVGRKKIPTPPALKVKAKELGLAIFQPASLKTADALETIKATKPDVGVLAAYGKIIPKPIIDLFPKGILNVHPSLLPRWRGPTPIQAAILADDQKTGATIILIDEEVDHGPILAQRELPITNYQLPNYPILHDALAKLGADILAETLPKWMSNELSPAPQDHAAATFCRKFSRQDAKIDWSKPAEEIDRMVRALNPEPGTWTVYRGKQQETRNRWETKNKEQDTRDKKLKILQEAQPFSNSRELENRKIDRKIDEWRMLKILTARTFQHSQECRNVVRGGICAHEGRPVVKCGAGALMLEIVQPEGKKPMSGEAFLRGHRDLISTILR
jgi:methionyl-tRNA formyltransferase